MTKKALIALLFVPFVIAIFAFVTSIYVIRDVEVDIRDILWNYKTNTPFRLDEGEVKLEAEGVYDEKYPLSEGNELVWSSSDPNIANTVQKGNDWYLELEEAGQTTITCSNAKKTRSKAFTAVVIGDEGAIIVNPVRAFSQQNIDPVNYVGLYDLQYSSLGKDCYTKAQAEFPFEVDIYSDFGLEPSQLEVTSTPNVQVDMSNDTIDILAPGKARIEFKNPYATSDVGNAVLTFDIIDGVNVYSYDDLMAATNYSSTGEAVVMRVNLESFQNTYKENADGTLTKINDNTELFGRLDADNEFRFKEDAYSFETSYNHDFLKEWNQYCIEHEMVDSQVSYNCVAGVRIRQDFYGNGFTLNAHNLAYPSDESQITVDGTTTIIPKLADKDLFRGPRLFLSLGYPKTYGESTVSSAAYPPFALYGQDNCGFLVEGDDIIVDDVHFKNCDFGNNYNNLEYTGTVLEVMGDNVTIKNSIIENGRNVIRAFSCDNLAIDNCLLSNAMEFLVRLGSNKANHVDMQKQFTYTDSQGKQVTTTSEEYLKPLLNNSGIDTDMLYGDKGDAVLTWGAIYNTQANEFIGVDNSNLSKDYLLQAKDYVAEALTNTDGIVNADGTYNYGGTCTIKDTYFYHSGISAICLDTMPQGSYLQNNITSLFMFLLAQYVPVMPSNMAYTSYPVHLTITGDTRFYDWKDPNDLDFSSLIFQDLNAFITAHGGIAGDSHVTDSDYLPLRDIILNRNKDIYVDSEGKQHVNFPIFFMGGGSNFSTVDIDSNLQENFSSRFELDPYAWGMDKVQEHSNNFNTDGKAKYQAIVIAMQKATSDVLGFNDYAFTPLNSSSHPWLNETPDKGDLIERAQGKASSDTYTESENSFPIEAKKNTIDYSCDVSKLRRSVLLRA